MKNQIKYLLLVVLVLLFSAAFSQVLDSHVTLKANNKPLSQVLFQLSEQAHFDFSYDTRIISPYKTVSINAQNQPLGEVLNTICNQSDIRYKQLGNQIIFFANQKEQVRRIQHHIRGTVRDYNSGVALSGVQVTEKYFQLSANTNADGSYELNIPNPEYTVQLSYALDGYQKKSYLVKVADNKTFNVALKSKAEKNIASVKTDTAIQLKSITVKKSLKEKLLEVKNDSVKLKQLSQPLIQNKSLGLVVRKSIIDSLKKDSTLNVVPYQFSILPGIGYNAQFGGKNIVEGVSFNLLAGLNAGIKGVEVGTIANLTRFNVEGVQVAGIANLVNGQTDGVQVAGIVNIAKLKTHGIQIGGISNLVGAEMEGIQVGGINNIVRGDMVGVQAAGIHNLITGNTEGIQVSGFANTAWGKVNGGQFAGFLNTAKGEVRGPQVAGFMNLAKSVKGTQAAGFLNYAQKLNGVQLSVFNFVDSLEGGLPIGFFNYVGNGYRRFELQGSETGILNLKFKTGTHRLYTVFGFGVRDNDSANNFLWDINYGIGTVFRDGKPLFFNLELSSHWLNPGKWSEEVNLLNRFDANLGIKLYKSLELTVGPAFNFYIVHESLLEQTILNKQALLFDEKRRDFNLQGWVGLNASIQVKIF